MTPEELFKIRNNPNLRIGDIPGLEELLATAQAFPKAKPLENWIHRIVKQLESRALASGDDWYGAYPPLGSLKNIPGIPIELPNGDTFQLEIEPLNRHLMVAGREGTGKTSFLQYLLYHLLEKSDSPPIVIVFERKNEGESVDSQAFVGLPVHIFLCQELSMIPFQPPNGMDENVWASLAIPCIASCLGLHASQTKIRDAYDEIAQKERPEKQNVRFSQVVSELDKMRKGRNYHEANLADSAYGKLSSVLSVFGNAIDACYSNCLDALTDSPGITVVNMGDIPEVEAGLWCNLFLLMEYHKRKRAFRNRIYFIFDDSLKITFGSQYTESQGQISPIIDIARMSRSLDCCLVYLPHSYKSTSPLLREMTHSIVICGASTGEEIDLIAKDLQLSKEERSTIPLLTPGTVIVKSPVYPRAVRGYFPKLPKRETSFGRDEDMKRWFEENQVEVLFSTFPEANIEIVDIPDAPEPAPAAIPEAVEQVIEKVETAEELPEKAVRLIDSAAYHPEFTLLRHYDSCGFSKETGRSALKSLLALGFVISHKVQAQKDGRPSQVLELTEKAIEYLKKRMITPVEAPHSEGDYLHRMVFPLWIMGFYTGMIFSFGKRWGEKEVDIVAEGDQLLLAFEINCTGSPQWNASQMLKACRVQGFYRVYSVTEKEKENKAIRREFEKLEGASSFLGKIEYKCAYEFLEKSDEKAEE